MFLLETLAWLVLTGMLFIGGAAFFSLLPNTKGYQRVVNTKEFGMLWLIISAAVAMWVVS